MELLLRGAGVVAAKSVLLLLESKHPVVPPALFDLRKSALVALGAAAVVEPSKQFAVVP